MALHQTSWLVTQAAAEPHAIIRVKNLQTVAKVGSDAWGRLNKLQPVLISASVSLRDAFSTASESDTVTNSTIHYGVLSKDILGAIELFNGDGDGKWLRGEGRGDLRGLLDCVFSALTHSSLDSTADESIHSKAPLLNPAMVKALEIKILLPKASLIGNGVSLTGAAAYNEEGPTRCVGCYSTILKLHDLRVPTLIGINANERLAKQIVVANVEVERWVLSSKNTDAYAELEEIVVKTIEESSFQTLEALAAHVGRRIVKFFLAVRAANPALHHVKITLEKPTAVTWADAPAVEMLLSSDRNPQLPIEVPGAGTGAKIVPFPLQGRLDEWIRDNYPGDST